MNNRTHEPTCAYYGLPFRTGSANRICTCPGKAVTNVEDDAACPHYQGDLDTECVLPRGHAGLHKNRGELLTARPRLPEDVRLTEHESEVARRWFAGEATEEELREVIRTHIQRLVETGVIQVNQPGHSQFTDESGTWCHEDCPMPDDECGQLAIEQNDPSTRPEDAMTRYLDILETLGPSPRLQKIIAEMRAERESDG